MINSATYPISRPSKCCGFRRSWRSTSMRTPTNEGEVKRQWFFPVDVWNVLIQVISDSLGRINTSTLWYEEDGTECVWLTRSLTKVYYYVGTLYFAWDLESCWMGISVWNKNIATLCMKTWKRILFCDSFLALYKTDKGLIPMLLSPSQMIMATKSLLVGRSEWLK